MTAKKPKGAASPGDQDRMLEELWEGALLDAMQRGDRGLLCMLLRRDFEASHAGEAFAKADGMRSPEGLPMPRSVRLAIADLLEGNSEWPMKKPTRAQIMQNVIRMEYQGLIKKLPTKKKIYAQLSARHAISEETIRDIIERRKTFGENNGKTPQQ